MNDILKYNTLIDSLTVTPMWYHLSYALTYTPSDTLTYCLLSNNINSNFEKLIELPVIGYLRFKMPANGYTYMRC